MPMHRFFKLFAVILATFLCFSCATIKNPTVAAYRKVLVLLHLKNGSDSNSETNPQVCLLDPSSMIPEQSSPQAQSKESPSVEVAELAHDFGPVREDGDYVHHFKIKNVGKAVLSIKKVIPG